MLVAQFDVVRMRNGQLGVVLQDDRLDSIATRVVAPLLSLEAAGIQPRHLCPAFEVDGVTMVCLTPSLAAVSLRDLLNVEFSLETYREDFIRALDLLFTGV